MAQVGGASVGIVTFLFSPPIFHRPTAALSCANLLHVMAHIDVTRLLEEVQAGDRQAFDVLLARVYDELRGLAHAQLHRERSDHTLSATDLVHEAYLRLSEHRAMEWKNRAHFFGTAAHAMRRILIDYARSKQAKKRAGQRVSLTLAEGREGGRDVTLARLLEIEDALDGLGKLNERWVRVVECRYFGGLTIEETAAVLGVSDVTVSKDWRMARAWLQRELAS